MEDYRSSQCLNKSVGVVHTMIVMIKEGKVIFALEIQFCVLEKSVKQTVFLKY